MYSFPFKPVFLTSKLLAIAAVIAFCVSSYSATLTEHMDIECRQSQRHALDCDYRILNGAELAASTAQYDGGSLAARTAAPETPDLRPDAMLFLVDTSDPSRADVIKKNRDHIHELSHLGSANHIFGLATFDSEFNFLCEFPCSEDDLAITTETLVAQGKTTELYRNLLEAIKQLDNVDAKHRHIILMSDGLAEDLAYFHNDVIRAARKNKIAISAIGYPRSISESVALQTLRRLAEETGGLFIQADHINHSVPESFFTQIHSVFDSVGQLSFDLQGIPRTAVARTLEVSLAFQTSEDNFSVVVPVVIPKMKVPEPPKIEPVALEDVRHTAMSPASKSVTLPPAGPSPWSWFWYGLPAIVFSAILALALSYAVVSRRGRLGRQTTDIGANSSAYLVSVNDDDVRHKLNRTPWRIGRSRSSELRLNDTSVSRLHAEIRRDALGQFTVQDMESLNGVFVNGEPVEMAHLEENDRVEIGDVGFIFTLRDEQYDHQEPTAYIHTLKPRSAD
ncbi:MAG: hypothetical protein ACI915_003612 [Gammaproteobacteria bacterium]